MIDETNIEQLLLDYFSNSLDQKTSQEVEKWINQSEENFNLALKFCKIDRAVNSARFRTGKDTEIALGEIHKRIRKHHFIHASITLSRIAAVIAIPLMCLSAFLGMKLYNNAKYYDSEVVMTTGSGMTTMAKLPDGSEVWLNSNTTLRYPVKFSKVRRVELSGEGFFKVQKQNGHKFIVKAGDVDVEVRGTQFDVEAYSANNSEVRTTLLSGSVALRYTDGQDEKREILMKPGDRYTYNTSTYNLGYEKIDNEATVISWRDGNIVLKNTPLSEALRLIGNYYNVDFDVRNPELLKNKFTGTFRNQRLEVILGTFAKTTKMDFEYLDNSTDGKTTGRQTIIIR